MFDLHYDLLSILYLCHLKNDFTYIEEIRDRFNEFNVKGLIANLYFMSESEMLEESPLYGDIDVVEMFKISTSLYKEYFNDIPCIFSIEGCDYVKIGDLQKLYNLGLRNILLVWNNKNIYGSGPRTDDGLTQDGINFLEECMRLGICIDFSHANDKTFDGMFNVVNGYKYVIASHSNIRPLTDVKRNLNDSELEKLKVMDGVLGLVSYKAFLGDPNNMASVTKEDYLNHILYAVDKLGIDRVSVSSDDMTFDEHYISDCLFDYSRINYETRELLLTRFNEDEVNKIMYDNAYNKLKELI